MKLYRTALFIALRHSGRRLLCLLLMLAVLAGAGAQALRISPEQPRAPITLAIALEESSPALESMIGSLLRTRFEGALEIVFVDSSANPADYSALVLLPDGFYDGLMTGENVPPTVVLNLKSPLEALLVKQLALSATRALTAAQQIIGALNVQLWASAQETDVGKLLLSANLSLIDSYFAREALMQTQLLQATGSLGLVAYYLVAIGCMLLFAYAFLLMPSISALRRFAAQSGQTAPCLLASLTLCVLVSALAAVPLALAAGMDAALLPSLLLLTLLYAAVLFAIGSLFHSAAACAAICIGLALAQGLFCGAFLPAALLPGSVAAFGAWLPLAQVVRLVTALLTGAALPALLLPALLTSAALFSAGMAGWRFLAKGAA